MSENHVDNMFFLLFINRILILLNGLEIIYDTTI